MASSYYDSTGKEVYDGNIAYAADVNTINTAVNTAFELVESAIDAVNNDSELWAQDAEAWATTAEDTEVEPGKYSALHYKEKASDSAVAAAASASSASGSASAASSSASTASSAASTATSAKNAAETAETNAELAETNAETAQAAAELAETNAEAAEALAEKWASEDEDVVVADGKYSAYHYATKAAAVAGDIEDTAFGAGWNGVTTKAPSKNAVYDAIILKQDIIEPIGSLQDKGSTSGAVSMDCSLYDTFIVTQTGSITITLANMSVGRTISIILNAGDNGVTWPSEVKWPEAEAPTFTSGQDRVVLQKITSSIIHASLAGQGYA